MEFVCIIKEIYYQDISKLNISPSTCYVGFQYKIKLAILGLPIGHPIKITMNFNEFHVKQLKSSFLVILGDFIARSKSWCLDDIVTYEGSKIDSLATTHGFHQLISQPTHLLRTSSTCIDLIFTDQPNLVVNSGIHPSLHKNCHHQITFCKLNLETEHPPPYERLVWDYKKQIQIPLGKPLNKLIGNFYFPIKMIMNKLLS